MMPRQIVDLAIRIKWVEIVGNLAELKTELLKFILAGTDQLEEDRPANSQSAKQHSKSEAPADSEDLKHRLSDIVQLSDSKMELEIALASDEFIFKDHLLPTKARSRRMMLIFKKTLNGPVSGSCLCARDGELNTLVSLRTSMHLASVKSWLTAFV